MTKKKEAQEDLLEARALGYDDGYLGVGYYNPYEKGTRARDAYNEGYNTAAADSEES